MAGEESADLTGRRLGNYRIDGVLGRGGMSVMYRATDVRLGRKVALKVIGEHLGADAEFRERFVDEARNTSAIDHANIVPLYDFGELDGMLYIAMRLVDGSDLASLVAGRAMPPPRALGLLDQVADALDTLHDRGLVHLDVKPANVLVTSRESAREHVYIADFGLTRRGTTGHRTRSGDFLGSPTYAAPEHLRGEPLDGRTDQYALACMLFACLTGQPPFTGDVQAVIKGHLSGDVPSVSGAVPSIPPAVDDVVRRGMAKSPENRYPNCVELVAAARTAVERSGGAPRDRRQEAARHGEGAPVQPFGAQHGNGPQGPQGQGPQAPQGQGPQGPPPGPGAFGQQPPGVGPPGQGFPAGQPPGMPPPQQGQPGPGYGQPPAPQAGPMGSPYGTPPHGSPPVGVPPGYGQQGYPQPGGPGAPGGPGGGGRKKSPPWWVWALVAAVVVGAGIAVVVLLTSGDDDGGGGGGDNAPVPGGSETSDNSTLPEIPVGPGDPTGGTDSGPTGGLPPTSIPIVPGG
ncbi:serine/threonine protein kinase [Saccharomonospora piscinae]|uniref:serine/threonine-protein kinase n=1 Tax=Saccharomonospora piscinae TaxID=687388 RepID=UPI001105C56A|nr:serine/threonine-protein kinase [Saccharomonospora piscinae]TLW91550.1 serine/threonine protein kinase [Saccharomonospora piscinae]